MMPILKEVFNMGYAMIYCWSNLSISVQTHPVISANWRMDHPLFGFAGKRGIKNTKKLCYCERSVAISTCRAALYSIEIASCLAMTWWL
ncbi:MAG: hypothetical protein JWR38_2656 [Mucilaginibacter sp.]|nr:hypothetical protein [Mucilaginibacter sp.]